MRLGMVVRFLLLLLISVTSAAIFTYHSEVHRFGNLSVVYSLNGIPATEVRVDGCIYYVVRSYDPEVSRAFKEAVKKVGETNDVLEKWRIRFGLDVWPVIDMELRAANYSGPLDFVYCCDTGAEKITAVRLSKASRWVNKTLSLVEKVEGALKEAGAEVRSIYVSVSQGFAGVDVFVRPGKGAGLLAKVKNKLDNVFRSYGNTPFLLLINIHEAPPPSPYIKGIDEEELKERYVKLYKIILQIYEDIGMSVKPHDDVLIGIRPNKGIVMLLKAPPNEDNFLKTLTERTVKEFGTCPNGTIIELARDIRVEEPIGVEIPWGLVITETTALAVGATALIYLTRRILRGK